jgi:hypothetical protein
VHRAASRHLDPDGGDLLCRPGRRRCPHAGQALLHSGLDPEIGERRDQHRLEAADVLHDVAQPVPPLGQRHDGIADELTRAVIRDVAAPVGRFEIGTDIGRRHEQVRRVSLPAERVDVRMLEQQEVIIHGAGVKGALEAQGLPVRDAPEPAGSQNGRHASSASQSRVSMIDWMWRRNLEA